jgi:MoaA/NifB/PqqE/SkfB family radical SAM enzyme
VDGRLAWYARYAWRAAARGRVDPLFYGVALTDRCNLRCAGCRIPDLGRPDLTWEALDALLRGAHARGFRELYFSGGEPMLWRDGTRTVEDGIRLARRLGFYHVHLYTNGTSGLATSADLVWVSVDGLPETYNLRRGDHFAEVEAAIREPGHPPVAVLYVIDRATRDGAEPFLRWVRDSALPVIGVMFYFQTPYYGYDELFLDAGERQPAIDTLLACRRAGLPVLNSRAGLLALRSGRWARRTPAAAVADVDGESVCCRAPDWCCADCGYAACTEIAEALRLRPSAVLAMGRYR